MQCKWNSRDKIYLTLIIYIMGRKNQRRELRRLTEWRKKIIRESKKFLTQGYILQGIGNPFIGFPDGFN